MKHHVLSAAAAVLMFTAPVAVQAQDVTLSRIEVQTDLSAYEDSNASEFWPSLEADLGRAIASVVTVDETAPAPAIRVEINKIAISGSPILPDTGEFNEMEGTVAVFRGLEEDVTSGSQEDATPNEIERSFPIKVSGAFSSPARKRDAAVRAAAKKPFMSALPSPWNTPSSRSVSVHGSDAQPSGSVGTVSV